MTIKDKPIYAVVDIEATSGSIDKNESMIQFACILYQNGKIIEEFNTLVNPLRPVPIRIQRLTGITQAEVNRAPLFEEIAPIIKDLLDEAIFVAHNVSFDYNFINLQLESVGLDPLVSKAIDTVDLAQIIFPSADYYNLSDLSEYLGYDMDQAHDALHDAKATGFLLNAMMDKLRRLPLVTLEKLVELSPILPYQSGELIEAIYKEVIDNPDDLDQSLVVRDGLAIVSPTYDQTVRTRSNRLEYPLTDRDKATFFNPTFQLRQSQGDLMDHIYFYFEQSHGPMELAIEAPSGMGKSIGYLVPSVLNKEPVVISTFTTTLQDQLMNEALPLLNEVTNLDAKAVVIKGCEHFLSLTNFKRALIDVTSEDTEALICMRLLVWLTETRTGDMNEMGAFPMLQHPFWQQIQTTFSQLEQLPPDDFYPRLMQQAKQADIIITNHAYLVNDLSRENSVIPPYEHVIIDEAHHLPRVVTEMAEWEFSKRKLNKVIKKIGDSTSEGALLSDLMPYVHSKWLKDYQLLAVESTRLLISEQTGLFFNQFNHLLNDVINSNEKQWVKKPLESHYLFQKTKDLKQTFEDLIYQLQGIYQSLKEHESEMSTANSLDMHRVYTVLSNLTSLYDHFTVLTSIKDAMSVKWLEVYTKSFSKSMSLKAYSDHEKEVLLDKLHSIKNVIYMSSTLSVNQSVSFFEKQIKATHLKYVEFPSPYQLTEQVQIMLPTAMKPLKGLSKKQTYKTIMEQLAMITNNLNRKTLVLFHSLETLEKVSRKLYHSGFLNDVEIFSQTMSGSRHKIINQFKQADKAILMGSDSFFEGIDMPGNLLEVVVLTQLPFDSPDMPIVMHEHQKLEAAGENSFMADILPRAIIKMKQAFGRLIRSESDKGVFIILDERYLNKNYGKLFQKSLPTGEEYTRVPISHMAKEINAFLNED